MQPGAASPRLPTTKEYDMMGFGLAGGLWMILVIVLVILAIFALVKYLAN